MITDLSSLKGESINNGIDPCLSILSYSFVYDVVRRVIALGRGAELTKFDIESTYCLTPMHPQDWPLQGMAWEGHIYVDGALSFGLRSVPKLFMALADASLWILGQHVVQNPFTVWTIIF